MSTMLRSGFSDLVLADALPALEFIVQDEFESFQPVYEKLFNVKEMKTGIAQSSQVSSFAPAEAVGEAEQLPMQKIYQGFDKTYTAVKYGLMFASSQELIDDLEYDVLGANARKATKSFMSTVETVAANVLNNGFGTAGPDGQYLFDSDHPALAPGLADQSNLLAAAADLSMTSLKALVTLLRQTKDSGGNKINLKAKWLIVPAANEFLAYELCKSVMLPDSSNAYVNSVNSLRDQYAMEPLVWDYLTDEDATIVACDKMDHNLCFYWRKRPSIGSEYDFKSEIALTKLSGRFAAGYSDWRGLVGTPGA